MKKIFLYIILLLVTVLIFGCGKNNVFQGLVKEEESEDPITKAQMYLDEGKYEKAEKICRDLLKDNTYANDEDATIILAQALMGRGDISFSGLIKNLEKNTHSVSTSNFTLLTYISPGKRNYVYESANYFSGLDINDETILYASGLVQMCAAALKINDLFGDINGIIGGGAGGEPNDADVIDITWVANSTQLLGWIENSYSALSETFDDETINDTITSINATINQINNDVNSGTVTYGELKTLLGIN